MRMILRSVITHYKGKVFFIVYDDIHPENEGTTGIGWTIKDAIRDFCNQYNAWAFYDDDQALLLDEGDVSLIRTEVRLQQLTPSIRTATRYRCR